MITTQRNRKVCIGLRANTRWCDSGSLAVWEAAHLGRHSCLAIGELLCGRWRPGIHLLQRRWRHWTKLPSMLDSRLITMCSRLPMSQLFISCGFWKENSLTDRWDCLFVSASVSLSAAFQLHVTPRFFYPWWLPGLSVTPYISVSNFLSPNPPGSLIPRCKNNANNNNNNNNNKHTNNN